MKRDDTDRKIQEAYEKTVLSKGKKILKEETLQKIDRLSSDNIQKAYEDTVLSELKRTKVRGKSKSIPWRKLKQRLMALKRFKKKKPKKTKDAFNAQLFKKKGKRIKDRFKKLLKRIMRESTDYNDRILALAQHLDIDPEEVEQESYGGYSADGGEYEVLTDSEADQRVRDYIEESVWAFNTWFIEGAIDVADANRYYGLESDYYDEDEDEYIEIGDDDEVFFMAMGMDLTEYIESLQAKAESGNDELVSLINASGTMDGFVDDAIAADGRGHFLNGYDGSEEEEIVNGSPYFIYRTN